MAIIFIAFQIGDQEEFTFDDGAEHTCGYMPVFKAFFMLYTIVILLQSIFSFKQHCRVQKLEITRREIKTTQR